jgi:two-component system, OmpR family, phosphate regulon sensor histidine kinase PhoR
VQVSPSASDELMARVQNRATLELVMVVLSCGVIMLGVATILLAAERERRISTLKSEFVANVSHELKTPLALVRMFGEMLQSGRVASEEKRIDERAIQLAVINLIDNALKYAPGSEVVTVRAACEANGGVAGVAGVASRSIVVRVIDRGPGVPAEDRERIFERFVRGATSRATSGQRPIRGSGIGLALVKHSAESHGGRAWVEAANGSPGRANGRAGAPSRAPGGASFAISIPVA